MSEMVEKVEAAITKAGEDWLRAQPHQKSWYSVPRDVLARAAIEAMRYPTPEMESAAERSASEMQTYAWTIKDGYTDMIDAALSPAKPTT